MTKNKYQQTGYLIRMLKKGYLSKCENYKDITLLSVSGKVLNKVLLNLMGSPVDVQL